MSTAATTARFFRATETYIDYRNGRKTIQRGTIVESVPDGMEHFYEPIVTGVEQATAAPGERRQATIPRARADEQGRAERDAAAVAADDAPKALHACDEPGCDFLAETRAGLTSHKRSHQ